MARIRNVSPLGALDIPAAGVVADAGEVIDVADDVAADLVNQGVFVVVDDAPELTPDAPEEH